VPSTHGAGLLLLPWQMAFVSADAELFPGIYVYTKEKRIDCPAVAPLRGESLCLFCTA
jgi:hypothetical protein